ncbi:MAG: hypothetical protein Q8916_08180 [Bacteroidota bacterium]|nr:hypothetical protein [Bacteroidota bacterium]MDP4230363.1 hypothetical protein [Bacteroidota bacterium]MDP4236471.1 hypothetical protein [Bacteroidota bacterium]
MPNSTDDALAKLEQGLEQGLTWDNIGKSLASGIVSGLGGLAISELFTFLEDKKPIEELLSDFKQEIEQDLTVIITRVIYDAFRQNDLDHVIAYTRGLERNVRSEVRRRDAMLLDSDYNASNQALSSAEQLDLLGFGTYFLVLNLRAAINQDMRRLPPLNDDPQAWYNGLWQDILELVSEGKEYVTQRANEVYRINRSRVSILGGKTPPPGVLGFGYVITIDGIPSPADGTGTIFFNEPASWNIAHEQENRVITRLNHEADLKVFNPARDIMTELSKLTRTYWRPDILINTAE